jgi:hypothetical protein
MFREGEGGLIGGERKCMYGFWVRILVRSAASVRTWLFYVTLRRVTRGLSTSRSLRRRWRKFIERLMNKIPLFCCFRPTMSSSLVSLRTTRPAPSRRSWRIWSRRGRWRQATREDSPIYKSNCFCYPSRRSLNSGVCV